MSGREPYLEERGVEVVVLNNVECKRLMESFIERRPDVWYTSIARYSRVLCD